MNDIHLHCQACKRSQWLPEDCTACSYCGSTRLWEIETEDAFTPIPKVEMPVELKEWETT